MTHKFSRRLITVATVLGLAAFPAVAAPGDGGDRSGSRAAVPANAPGGAANNAPARRPIVARVEQRIADLHAKLQISSEQETLWGRFAQVMRDNAQSMDRTFLERVKAMPNLTAAQNMQSYARVAMEHAQQVQNLVPPFLALYDAMSETQKKTADIVFRQEMHRGEKGRRP
jgi:protein CpxP